MNESKKVFDEIARVIYSLRCEKNLTQEQLAKMAGVSQMTIHRVETGFDGLKLESALSLFKALDVSLSDLLRKVEANRERLPSVDDPQWDELSKRFIKLSDEDKLWFKDMAYGLFNKTSFQRQGSSLK